MILKNSHLIFPQERTCEVCKQTYNAVRTHQRFCSQKCHNKFHNQKRLAKTNRFKDYLDVIFQNHEILEKLWNQGKRQVPRVELINMGFDTSKFYGFDDYKKIISVFDYGFRYLKDDKIEILKLK